MNKKAIGAIGVIALALLLAGNAFANAETDTENNMPFGKRGMDPEKKAEMAEIKEQIMAAVEAGDYETWKAIHEENGLTEGPMFSTINEENFGLLTELYANKERAREIMEELGIEKPGFKKGFKGMKGMHKMGGCPYNTAE